MFRTPTKTQQEKRAKIWETQLRDGFIDRKFPIKLKKDLRTLHPIVQPEHIGKSMYLWGEPGTGKTLYACELLIANNKQAFVNSQLAPPTEFAVIPDLLSQIRQCFNDEYQGDDSILIEKYSTVDLLLLDDLGTEKSTEWVLQTLYTIINRRYNEDKLTIITSNFNTVQLEKELKHKRIPSRIHGMCSILYFGNKDHRIKKGSK